MSLQIRVIQLENGIVPAEKLLKFQVSVSFRGAVKVTERINALDNKIFWNELLEWPCAEKPSPNDEIKFSVYSTADQLTNRKRQVLGSASLVFGDSSSSNRLTLSSNKFQTEKRILEVMVTHRPLKQGLQELKELGSGLEDVQIHVQIVEARQLATDNEANPQCNVSIGDQTQSTRVCRSTNHPWWAETFSFRKITGIEQSTKQEILIRVHDISGSFRRTSKLIGQFQIGIGMIYDQEGHAFVNNWLMLFREESHENVPAGFLRFSVAVLLKPNDINPMQIGHQPSFVEDDSLLDSSSVLQSVAVRTQPACFVIDIFRAEDLPIMDTSLKCWRKKDHEKEVEGLIDPYVEVTFAGKTARTSVVRGNHQPLWNERLCLKFQLPCLSTALTFQLKDWDRFTADDVVAAANRLPLSAMAPDEGLLPTFGPAWLPFYGIKDLEGYRGRVLLSIRMLIGQQSISPHIPKDEIHKVEEEWTKNRTKYYLHATFIDATLLLESYFSNLSSIVFRISFGRYGLREEDYSTPSPPWDLDKPILLVLSEWEDARVRMQSLNALWYLVDRLATNSTKAEEEIKSSNCSIKKPTNPSTSLDTILFNLRKRELMSATPNIETLKHLAQEPQLGVPDIFVWMLTANGRRQACCRLSSHSLLRNSGLLSGKTQSLLLRTEDKPVCLLRVRLAIDIKVPKSISEQEDAADVKVHVFAEAYENQVLVCGTWKATRYIWNVPTWSDVTGQMPVDTNALTAPEGWHFEGDWFIHTPGSSIHEEKKLLKQEVLPTETENAIETTKEAKGGSTRKIKWKKSPRKILERLSPCLEGAGDSQKYLKEWNYRRNGVLRRRRWQRRLLPDDTTTFPLEAFFQNGTNFKPSIFLHFTERHSFQLRAYICQARDLLAGDDTGLSDAYVEISMLGSEGRSAAVAQSLCPEWNETLVCDVIVDGSLERTRKEPPMLLVKIFDKDILGKDDFLGWMYHRPKVIIKPSHSERPQLSWMELQGKGQILASFELLYAGRRERLPSLPKDRSDSGRLTLPKEIVPKRSEAFLDVICLGLRNLKSPDWLPVSKPYLEVICGQEMIRSDPLVKSFQPFHLQLKLKLPKETRHQQPVTIIVRDQRLFAKKTVIGLHVISELSSYFRRNAATHRLTRPRTSNDSQKLARPPPVEELQVDWWTKYEASKGKLHNLDKYIAAGYHTLQVYETELEKVNTFKEFNDFVQTFPLQKGSEACGEFRGNLSLRWRNGDVIMDPFLTRWLSNQEVLVRVYIIKAFNLTANDPGGKADPYLKVQFGAIVHSTRDRYHEQTLAPVFGEMMELSGTLPSSGDLHISVWDRDLLSADDLIGETVIDVEKRCCTRFRATSGLAEQYFISGPYVWRDSQSPREILESWHGCWNLPRPIFRGNAVVLGGEEYRLEDFEGTASENRPELGSSGQRLALHLLHALPHVPEHVEIRPLFNPTLGDNVPQGYLEMWVDIFPMALGFPGPPVDITPRKPIPYELRVVVVNTFEVPLQESNLAGDRMSDIFVRGWLREDSSRAQKTDVHYRSLDGEGNFNWRLVFPFRYFPMEGAMLWEAPSSSLLPWQREGQRLLPVRLSLQIWDADLLSADDYIGGIEMDLHKIPPPAKTNGDCGLHQLSMHCQCKQQKKKWWKHWFDRTKPRRQKKSVDLFENGTVSGFWPCIRSGPGGKHVIAGKIQMELELLTQKEAEERPVGQGREGPNPLPLPERPDSSFLWLFNPWKTFKFGIWRRHKFKLILVLFIVCVIFVVILIFTRIPDFLVKLA